MPLYRIISVQEGSESVEEPKVSEARSEKPAVQQIIHNKCSDGATGNRICSSTTGSVGFMLSLRHSHYVWDVSKLILISGDHSYAFLLFENPEK